MTREEFEIVKKAAEQGDAKAQYDLGFCYDYGRGVEQDHKKAVKWYTAAAEQGYAVAQYNLGVCYSNGIGVEEDYAEVTKWCRKAAEQGHTRAQFDLGFCYDYGEGVEQDYAEATKWYRKAAQQGHEGAQYYLNELKKKKEDKMKIYKTLEQNSPEWIEVRLGKFTASDFHIFLGNSKARTTALYKKAAERLTNSRCDQDSKVGGVHIDRGNSLEPLARESYERKTGYQVEQIGFIELSETVGFSPDGLINDDKLVEIKCMDNHTYLQSLKNKVCPEHYTQIQFGLMVTGRQNADYAIYNPHFTKPLFIRTIEREEEYIEKIKEALSRAEKEIEEINNIYNNNF